MVVSNNKGPLRNLAPKNETAIQIQVRALGKKTTIIGCIQIELYMKITISNINTCIYIHILRYLPSMLGKKETKSNSKKKNMSPTCECVYSASK